MRVLLLLSLILFNIRGIKAQDTTSNYYIELYSGERIFGHKVFFKNFHLYVDSARFGDASVKFFQNETGFFANTKSVTDTTSFGQRVVKGNINLYRQLSFEEPLSIIKANNYKRFRYYNFGDGELKKASFKNLRHALSANPESREALKGSTAGNAISVLFAAGGLTMTIYGLVLYSQRVEDSSSLGGAVLEGTIRGTGVILILTGVTSLATSAIVYSLSKIHAKKRAVKIFNGEL